MKKYLVVLKDRKDSSERFEVLMNFLDLKYEKLTETQYYLYATKERVEKLKTTFEWVAIIKTEL